MDVSKTTTDVDEGWSGRWYSRFIKFMRFIGGIVGCLSIALGFIMLIVLVQIDPRNVINAIYQIIFGFLILICELRLRYPLKHFRFLTHFLGLGAFYIFLGGLSLGGHWYQYAVGGVEIGLGIIYLVFGCFNKQMFEKKAISQNLKGSGTTAKTKLPDSAFTSDEIASTSDITLEEGTNTKGKKVKAVPPARPVEPTAPAVSTSAYAGVGNSASENPFEDFASEPARLTKGGYAI